MKIFEYVAYYNPTEDQIEDGKKPAIVIPLASMLAANEKVVQLQIARKIPDKFLDLLEQVEILVRPF